MLDHLLEVSYRADTEAKEKRAFVESLRALPLEDLSKLASGETTLAKLASMSCPPSTGGGNASWLEKYKGTPLFDQALALEQAELQNEMAQQQQRLQEQDSQQFWRENDKICLQKRMLDLQLVQSEQQMMAGAPLPPSPEAPAQGAGAPGAGAPNNEEMMGAAVEPGVKVSAAGLWSKLGSEKVTLTHAGKPMTEKQEKAHMANLHKIMWEKKAAPNLGAMGSGIMGNLGRVAKAMPQGALMHAGIGAGLGAAGGALAGGPDHRLSGALGGAALGGAGGLAGSNIARAASTGGGLSGATAMHGLQQTGRQMKAGGNAVVGGVNKGLRAAEPGVAPVLAPLAGSGVDVAVEAAKLRSPLGNAAARASGAVSGAADKFRSMGKTVQDTFRGATGRMQDAYAAA